MENDSLEFKSKRSINEIFTIMNGDRECGTIEYMHHERTKQWGYCGGEYVSQKHLLEIYYKVKELNEDA